MATQQTRSIGRIAVAPSVLALFLWMIVPLAMTVWFSFLRYNLLDPNPACSLMTPGALLDAANRCMAGAANYYYFLTDPAFFKAMRNSLLLVFWVLVISVAGGTLLALLLDQAIYGRNAVRLMVIAPFFVMPTVSALVWKNMMMHPVQGFLAWITKSLGLGAIDWFAHYPMTAIVIMVSWQWMPFATLIILTALQSFDEEQKEAAQMDGAPPLSFFWYMIVPHLARPVTVVILIETIFLLNIFAEIYVTGSGGRAGNLPFLVYHYGLLSNDIGGASAGGVIAVILANIAAFFLMRMIGKNLEA
ncbi:carbohydrate ABC transporter permease [Aestuariivirga sp.]|uniref:carbohydrate ABC transporter permease n=1 Tax=Aestuariivirga sp. TaxID=2650926 RepID=UPI0025BE5245|nr:sugar ABC transporter permease [Aestuariivirga sp.]MCA3554814.1 sugar ABC transporter permease [Aestuariivirga sp.]